MISREKVLEKFMSSPMFVKMAEEVQAEESAKADRQSTAEELAKLRKERPAVMAKLADELKQAEDGLKKAQEAVKEAKGRLTVVQGKCMGEAWGMDQRIRECESSLMRSAPQSLKEQLARKEQEIEGLRSMRVCGHVFPDLPEAVGWTAQDVEKVRLMPSEIEERRKEIEAVQKEVEKIKEQILKGE